MVRNKSKRPDKDNRESTIRKRASLSICLDQYQISISEEHQTKKIKQFNIKRQPNYDQNSNIHKKRRRLSSRKNNTFRKSMNSFDSLDLNPLKILTYSSRVTSRQARSNIRYINKSRTKEKLNQSNMRKEAKSRDWKSGRQLTQSQVRSKNTFLKAIRLVNRKARYYQKFKGKLLDEPKQEFKVDKPYLLNLEKRLPLFSNLYDTTYYMIEIRNCHFLDKVSKTPNKFVAHYRRGYSSFEMMKSLRSSVSILKEPQIVVAFDHGFKPTLFIDLEGILLSSQFLIDQDSLTAKKELVVYLKLTILEICDAFKTWFLYLLRSYFRSLQDSGTN